MKVFFQFFTKFFRLKNTLVARDYFTTSHILVDPLPYALNYGLFKVFFYGFIQGSRDTKEKILKNLKISI